ncbi:MAG: stage IV sporulation protein A [Clostridiales bacterium]|nr:stage IV sporulation protein A [Clostridiales bacterium]
MEKFDIYEEIARRTGGDIYVGVVGPVRTGKSMFITKFMENLVIPNIVNKFSKERAVDELPQSAEGKTIMTTQPKFVPNEAVRINLDNVEMKVRLIDCVGYMINGALGHEENDKPRLVKTPWDTKEIPFEDAAEIGTKKVIEDHSTIGILLTTDGTISDIPRSSYLQAEERVASELINQGKPFVTIVNSTKPNDSETINLTKTLAEKYNCSALAINVKEMQVNDIELIFAKVLQEFPIKSIKAKMPDWLQALPYDDTIIKNIIDEVKRFSDGLTKVGEIDKSATVFTENADFEPIVVDNVKMGEGTVYFDIKPKQDLFYKVLSNECGYCIKDDYELVTYLRDLAYAKQEYDKIASALEQVKETGYGIVEPRVEEIELDEPQIVKQGSRFGVKLKANAPSLHIMAVDVETEVSPLVGTQQQSEELVNYLTEQCEKDPGAIWQTNMFGKSLKSMVCDGIHSKVFQMPTEAQRKMRKTLGRIVNEGKGGIICILL